MNPIQTGDRIYFKPEFSDPGDENIIFIACENEDQAAVRVRAMVDLPFKPEQVVDTAMIARVESPVPGIAARFCQLLREQIGAEKLAEAVRRNATPAYAGCCASHDFCDANVLMDEAFKLYGGRTATDTGGEGIGIMSDAAQTLWQAAWQFARENRFNL